ncbi:hypothetical protein EYF80_048413 [Liparis tanakae]|uniref:Uncharacterized protein n=1 Tax=Liparis tanakae TaxID=230148 RepID=A0A4Z2FKA2_9TELE|nr:hypothetical protein EYF80_048413 [Liparis tanakae]
MTVKGQTQHERGAFSHSSRFPKPGLETGTPAATLSGYSGGLPEGGTEGWHDVDDAARRDGVDWKCRNTQLGSFDLVYIPGSYT